jgi:hypothetical protein
MNEWWADVANSVKEWLPTIKSRESGLYKLSKNACHDHSIDATSLAFDLHNMLGIEPIDAEAAFGFFDAQQEEQTGFYHESFVSELDLSVDRIIEMSGTYFGYQLAAVLMAYERKPKYLYRFYEQFIPKGAMETYMSNDMPWNRSPMGAGNMVDHGATMMRANAQFGDVKYQEVLVRMYQWLDTYQDGNTGLWGKETAQGKNGLVQGGYHLMRGLYFQDDRPPRFVERITDTTLASLDECSVFSEGEGEGCHDMDHFVVLDRMLHFSNGYREADIRSACERRLDQLQAMLCKDGAFSFEAKGSITNHNRYEVTSGLKESDLVGTVFYLETIYRILSILGYQVNWHSSITHGVTNES